MLTEHLDAVIGVDTHKHTHTAAAVASTGTVLDHLTVPTGPKGYRQVLAFGRRYGAALWAIEGTGSFGAGLTTLLLGQPRTRRRGRASAASCAASWRQERRCRCRARSPSGARRRWDQRATTSRRTRSHPGATDHASPSDRVPDPGDRGAARADCQRPRHGARAAAVLASRAAPTHLCRVAGLPAARRGSLRHGHGLAGHGATSARL
jgi:hypothetical protein